MSANIEKDCPFCDLPKERRWLESPSALAFEDAYPVTEGHTLVIPKRHVRSIFDLEPREQSRIWGFVGEVRLALVERWNPDGFNVGINDGMAAGQTIDHAHIHLIPRRLSEGTDPRGGIRWIFPDKARYWKS